MIRNKILEYSGIISEENIIEWEKFVKPLMDYNKKEITPYGKMIPKHILEVGDRKIYLPQDYTKFLDFIKKRDMKSITELDGAIEDFKKTKGDKNV